MAQAFDHYFLIANIAAKVDQEIPLRRRSPSLTIEEMFKMSAFFSLQLMKLKLVVLYISAEERQVCMAL